MVGYTKQSEGHKIEENDFEILRTIVSKVKHKVIAEGNINTPEKAKRVLELGAYSVVVGVDYHKTTAYYEVFCGSDWKVNNEPLF